MILGFPTQITLPLQAAYKVFKVNQCHLGCDSILGRFYSTRAEVFGQIFIQAAIIHSYDSFIYILTESDFMVSRTTDIPKPSVPNYDRRLLCDDTLPMPRVENLFLDISQRSLLSYPSAAAQTRKNVCW